MRCGVSDDERVRAGEVRRTLAADAAFAVSFTLIGPPMPASPAPAPLSPLIVPETSGHALGVERVLDRAFGPGRFAKPSERVREFATHRPDLSCVALLDGRVIGICRLYDITIGAAPAIF